MNTNDKVSLVLSIRDLERILKTARRELHAAKGLVISKDACVVITTDVSSSTDKDSTGCTPLHSTRLEGRVCGTSRTFRL
jgi:hypothetical protein